MITPLDAVRGYSQSNPAPMGALNVRIETAVRPLLVPLVLAGEGATVMERGHAERAALAGGVMADLDPPLSFPLWLLHRKTKLTPAAEAFRKLA
jgi:LysR family carnitine catabolism transcriptional activator